MFRFLSFTDEWYPQSRLSQRLSNADFCPELKIILRARDLPEFGFKPAFFSADFCPQTEDSFPNFSNKKNGILALRVYGPIIWLFPCPTIESGHDTRVTWIPLFAQWLHRVRGIDYRSYLLLTVSLCACWFKHRRVGESTSPFLSLQHTTSQYVHAYITCS